MAKKDNKKDGKTKFLMVTNEEMALWRRVLGGSDKVLPTYMMHRNRRMNSLGKGDAWTRKISLAATAENKILSMGSPTQIAKDTGQVRKKGKNKGTPSDTYRRTIDAMVSSGGANYSDYSRGGTGGMTYYLLETGEIVDGYDVFWADNPELAYWNALYCKEANDAFREARKQSKKEEKTTPENGEESHDDITDEGEDFSPPVGVSSDKSDDLGNSNNKTYAHQWAKVPPPVGVSSPTSGLKHITNILSLRDYSLSTLPAVSAGREKRRFSEFDFRLLSSLVKKNNEKNDAAAAPADDTPSGNGSEDLPETVIIMDDEPAAPASKKRVPPRVVEGLVKLWVDLKLQGHKRKRETLIKEMRASLNKLGKIYLGGGKELIAELTKAITNYGLIVAESKKSPKFRGGFKIQNFIEKEEYIAFLELEPDAPAATITTGHGRPPVEFKKSKKGQNQ